jgi:hypothetical protein
VGREGGISEKERRLRFMVPHKHTEAKRGRRWFLLIATRLFQSGPQKKVQVSIRGG